MLDFHRSCWNWRYTFIDITIIISTIILSFHSKKNHRNGLSNLRRRSQDFSWIKLYVQCRDLDCSVKEIIQSWIIWFENSMNDILIALRLITGSFKEIEMTVTNWLIHMDYRDHFLFSKWVHQRIRIYLRFERRLAWRLCGVNS